MPIKKDYHNTQVLNEIYFYVMNKNLIPKIALSYDREAFFAIDNPDVRITFDFNILSRREDVTINRSKEDKFIVDGDLIIMEIKTSTSFPLWLTKVLTKHHIYSNSFSKYGTEFFEHLITTKEASTSCLNPYLTYQARV